MTTPKDQDQDQAKNSSDNAELYDSIDELENLITGKAGNSGQGQSEQHIPVLDDVVDPDESGLYEDEDDDPLTMDPAEDTEQLSHEYITREQLDVLIGNMENKLSGELDELVNILKDAIKESIITGIKTQLDSKPEPQDPSAKTDGDPPA